MKVFFLTSLLTLLLYGYAGAQSHPAAAKPHPKAPHHTSSQHDAKIHHDPNAAHHTTHSGQQEKNFHQSKKYYNKVSDAVTDQKHHKASGSASHSKSSAAQHKKKQMAQLKQRNQKNDGVFSLY